MIYLLTSKLIWNSRLDKAKVHLSNTSGLITVQLNNQNSPEFEVSLSEVRQVPSTPGMSTVIDLQKKIKSIIDSLHKSIECPVCCKTVTGSFKLCSSGHGICLVCAVRDETCPLCQEQFILDNPIFVKSIIEAVPHFCRFSEDGCEEIVESRNGHEAFCGYRPIECRYLECPMTVTVNQLLRHSETRHPDWSVKRDEVFAMEWPMQPDHHTFHYTPVVVHSTLFWILKVNDITEKQLKMYFQTTPIGELDHDYYARITFSKNYFIYTYTLRASVLSSCERKFTLHKQEGIEDDKNEFCMKIPQSQLSKFINKNGRLCFKCQVFRV